MAAGLVEAGIQGVIQMLVASPGTDGVALKLSQFFRYGAALGSGRAQIWMQSTAQLEAGSPWQALLQEGQVGARPHPQPALLLLSDAADWLAADQFYGPKSTIPRLQLLWGSTLCGWGHGALQGPAVRVALGRSVAQALAASGLLREPIHTLSMGLDPNDLPQLVEERRVGEVLILAATQPTLGLMLQQSLRRRGLRCRCELSPWPIQQQQQALAEAEVAVVLAPACGAPGLGLRRLAAMALQTPLVCEARDPDDALCRDGHNALVRPGEAEALAQAAADLLAAGGARLRRQLIDGGLATLVRHRRALEQLEFGQLLGRLPQLWQEARSCHPETTSMIRPLQ